MSSIKIYPIVLSRITFKTFLKIKQKERSWADMEQLELNIMIIMDTEKLVSYYILRKKWKREKQ